MKALDEMNDDQIKALIGAGYRTVDDLRDVTVDELVTNRRSRSRPCAASSSRVALIQTQGPQRRAQAFTRRQEAARKTLVQARRLRKEKEAQLELEETARTFQQDAARVSR